jgi:hypothetical protein
VASRFSPTGDGPEEVGLRGSQSTVQYRQLFRPATLALSSKLPYPAVQP